MRHVTSALWLALALAACSSKPDAPPPPKPGSAGSAAVAPAASGAPIVEVFVNDTSVAKVTAAQAAEWPRLDSLVPPENRKLGQWGAITLTGADGKPVELTKPFDTYPDMVPAIVPTGAGAGFGMYDAVELAKHGTPGMHQDNLKSIKISISDNGHGGGGDDNNEVGDPTKLVLTFKTPAGTTQVPGAKLLALPREPMPGGGESKGWKLSALLAAGGITTFEKLLLADAAGANLVLEKADFDEKTSVPFVKLNKKGLLRVTVYKKKGEGWTPGADLRALASVEVTK